MHAGKWQIIAVSSNRGACKKTRQAKQEQECSKALAPFSVKQAEASMLFIESADFLPACFPKGRRTLPLAVAVNFRHALEQANQGPRRVGGHHEEHDGVRSRIEKAEANRQVRLAAYVSSIQRRPLVVTA